MSDSKTLVIFYDIAHGHDVTEWTHSMSLSTIPIVGDNIFLEHIVVDGRIISIRTTEGVVSKRTFVSKERGGIKWLIGIKVEAIHKDKLR